MENEEFLKRFADIISPEVIRLDTAWEYIYLFLSAFDGNVAGSFVSVKPDSASSPDWPTDEVERMIDDLMMAWQRSASGQGAKSFSAVVRIDRRDLAARFFYGEDAERWNIVSVGWQELTRNADLLFSSDS